MTLTLRSSDPCNGTKFHEPFARALHIILPPGLSCWALLSCLSAAWLVMGGGPSEPTGDLLRICCCGGERLVWQRCTCMGICAPTAGRSSTKLLNPVQQTLLTVPWPTVQRRQRWEKDRLATHAVLRHLALRNLSGAFFHGVCRFPPLLPSGARGCRGAPSQPSPNVSARRRRWP